MKLREKNISTLALNRLVMLENKTPLGSPSLSFSAVNA